MKVGIVGASGYSGEVLVKLLLGHPNVTLAAVTSRSNAGKPLASVIPTVRGADQGLTFTDSDPAALAAAVTRLFSDRQGYERMSRAASEHVLREFEFDAHVDAVMSVLIGRAERL